VEVTEALEVEEVALVDEVGPFYESCRLFWTYD
jgi:hypothetical protein